MLNIDDMQKKLLALGGTYILNHAKRDLLFCHMIAEQEHMDYDEDIITFSCYFHDISAFKPYRPEGLFDHALESSKAAPLLAEEYGIDNSKIDTIVEAVKYHDKRGQGTANETILLRNADAIDYLGYMAVARDFSKQPNEMVKAIAALKKHRNDFAALLELDAAIQIAQPKINNLDFFLCEFEQESLGVY